MLIVTAEQMKTIEANSTEYALSMERLMENAGSAAAIAIRQITDVEGRFVTIFCGRGNCLDGWKKEENKQSMLLEYTNRKDKSI